VNFLMAALPIVGEWVGKIIDAVAKYRQGQIDMEALRKTANDATDAMVARLANIPADASATNAAVDAIGAARFPDEVTPTSPPPVIIPDAPAESLPILSEEDIDDAIAMLPPEAFVRLMAKMAARASGSER
jgi:hypothetical protein